MKRPVIQLMFNPRKPSSSKIEFWRGPEHDLPDVPYGFNGHVTTEAYESAINKLKNGSLRKMGPWGRDIVSTLFYGNKGVLITIPTCPNTLFEDDRQINFYGSNLVPLLEQAKKLDLSYHLDRSAKLFAKRKNLLR